MPQFDGAFTAGDPEIDPQLVHFASEADVRVFHSKFRCVLVLYYCGARTVFCTYRYLFSSIERSSC